MRVAFFLVICGCASNGGSVSGNVPGGGFDFADTVSATITTNDGNGGTSSYAQIVIGSTSGLCGDAGAVPPIDRKGSRAIIIELRDITGSQSTAPAAAAPYTIYPNTGSEPPKSASLMTVGLDNTCQTVDAQTAQAQSGTVTLTAASGGVYKGSFDVTLNTGDHLTGSFDPTACPALQAAATNSDTPRCM
ncbi:MAG: hypothetical protein JO257_34690 [Deltaproteobacteria bacterium]|nr:hypothetical protein [Deltaproteobacteria bacterium]